jgi:hypothetical protein
MMNRREWIALSALPAFAQASAPDWMTQVIERHDAGVERLLKTQITDSKSHGCGSYADEYGPL